MKLNYRNNNSLYNDVETMSFWILSWIPYINMKFQGAI